MGLKDGGEIVGAFIVVRSNKEHVVYMRGSWVLGRAFRLIHYYRGWAGHRSFKKLESAWAYIQKFGYTGHVTVYHAGDPRLRRFTGVAPQDLGEPAPAPATLGNVYAPAPGTTVQHGSQNE
jgi:hypothetical protein